MKRLALSLLVPMMMFAVVRWRVLESENFRLVYPEGYSETAREAVTWMEAERDNINELTGWEPRKTWVVIEDPGMNVNGWANPVANETHLFVTQPVGGDLTTRNWMRHVGVHEFVHISSIQPVYGITKFLNVLLGPWVLPNAAVPGWMIEGVTVYYESQVEPYEGRLESGFYDANLLTRAAQGSFPRTWEMDGSILSFPWGHIYAYGGPFFEWVVENKGVETISQFYRRNGRNFPLFFLDGAARKTIGDRFPTMLADWKADVIAQSASFSPADIWAESDPHARKLTGDGWYVDNLVTDGELVYYTRTRYFKPAAMYVDGYTEVIALDLETGEEQVLLRPNTSVLEIKVHEGVLFYTPLTYRPGFANTYQFSLGSLYELRSYAIETGHEDKFYTGRIRSFGCVSDGSFLISLDRTPEFGSRLIQLDPILGEEPFELYSGDLLIGEIVISDRGARYYSARYQGHQWDVYKFSSSDQTWTNLTNTPWGEVNLSLDTDGNLLYAANPHGTAGEIGLYTLDIENNITSRFEAPSYGLYPVRVGDDLAFASINPAGYDIYSAPAQTSPASLPEVPMVSRPPLPEVSFQSRSRFRPYLSLLRPWARIPLVFPGIVGYYDVSDNSYDYFIPHLWVGGFLFGADVVGENSYQIIAFYDAFNNAPDVEISWQNSRVAPFFLNLFAGYNSLWSYDYLLHVANLDGYSWTVYPSFSHLACYRPGRGLNRLTWGAGFRMAGDSLQNRTLITNAGLSFSWPFWALGLAASHQWDSPVFSSTERSWLFSRTGASVNLLGGFLIADARGFADFSAILPDTYTHYSPIRGYDAISSAEPFFVTSTLEYRHRLFEMRFGIWNPNVFFEDFYVNVFCDAAFDPHNTLNLLGASAGIELSPEIHLFWGHLRLAPVIGVSINLEGEPNFHFGLVSSLPISYRNPRRDVLEFIPDPRVDPPVEQLPRVR